MTGDRNSGLAELRDGLNYYRKANSKLLAPYRLGRAVAAFLQVGQIEDGMGLLAEAFEAMEAWGERWYEPELYRFRGLLLLAASIDAQAAAEACFQHAMAVAHAQGARLFELRAAVALGQQQCGFDERRQRRALLASVVESFEEGSGMPDLETAKALLNTL
jgi:predicted ATPase